MSQIKTKFIGDDQVTDAKVRLSNNAAFRARNAADSADVNLMLLDGSDVLQFSSHPQSSASAASANDVLTRKDLTGGDGVGVSAVTISVDHDGEGLTFDTAQLALELDGTTLSKSGTGLKVGTITESELGSDIDAESFALSAGYAAAAGTVTIADSIEVAIEKIVGNIEAISTSTFAQETFFLNSTDIDNQYVQLAQTPDAGNVHLQPADGLPQIETVDYTVSTNLVTFAGDLATGGDAALVDGDTIYIKYSY